MGAYIRVKRSSCSTRFARFEHLMARIDFEDDEWHRGRGVSGQRRYKGVGIKPNDISVGRRREIWSRGEGKTNLRVARMTFQQCGRLEQLLTEYCNHYVSICHAAEASVSVSVLFATKKRKKKKKNDRVSDAPSGRDNRLAFEIENHSRNAANQTVSTWNLISVPALVSSPSRNDDNHRVDELLLSVTVSLRFCSSVGSIYFHHFNRRASHVIIPVNLRSTSLFL